MMRVYHGLQQLSTYKVAIGDNYNLFKTINNGLWVSLLYEISKHICLLYTSFAAGAMIYVVVAELIPESQTNEKKDIMALFTLVGFSIMMILDVALG